MHTLACPYLWGSNNKQCTKQNRFKTCHYGHIYIKRVYVYVFWTSHTLFLLENTLIETFYTENSKKEKMARNIDDSKCRANISCIQILKSHVNKIDIFQTNEQKTDLHKRLQHTAAKVAVHSKP